VTHRFLKFLVVGGLNTAFNYGIYALFIYLGAGYFIAATMSFVIGIFVSFLSHGRYVFQSRASPYRSFFLYVVSWIALYVANVSVLGLLVRNGVDSYLAGALMVPPMAVLSFVVLRFIVFRHGPSAESP
jgi:putative flippase GtrA